MGTLTSFICRTCGTHFAARQGGTRYSDLLHCEACGADLPLSHEELGDVHLRYIKGLSVPYAVSRMKFDRWIQAHYPGEPLDRGSYETAVESLQAACACGGRFTYRAEPRCPTCRSVPADWERDPEGHVAYIC